MYIYIYYLHAYTHTYTHDGRLGTTSITTRTVPKVKLNHVCVYIHT
jgi:hypothetical protein